MNTARTEKEKVSLSSKPRKDGTFTSGSLSASEDATMEEVTECAIENLEAMRKEGGTWYYSNWLTNVHQVAAFAEIDGVKIYDRQFREVPLERLREMAQKDKAEWDCAKSQLGQIFVATAPLNQEAGAPFVQCIVEKGGRVVDIVDGLEEVQLDRGQIVIELHKDHAPELVETHDVFIRRNRRVEYRRKQIQEKEQEKN